MTNELDFSGWSKRNSAIWLDGHADVSVSIGTPGNQAFGPFLVSAKGFTQSFNYLDDAMRFAKQVAIGLTFLAGDTPLPIESTAEEDFLANRGLKP